MDALDQYTNNLLPSLRVHDRQLENDVAHAMQATGYFAVSLVDIHAHNGVVYLRGRVRSYYHKQVAQTAAASVLGHRQLVNELRVVPSEIVASRGYTRRWGPQSKHEQPRHR